MDVGKGLKIFIFSLTLVFFCVIVSVFPYDYYDSDSSCYSYISQKLAFQPLETWCAPQWWGHGGNQGFFRDHPPGIFWLAAILVRVGIKDSVAALCANFIYILLCLYFLYKLAMAWGDSALGWAAVFGFVLTPIFLQYLLRGNQEQPLNLAVVAGLYGLSRSQKSILYKLLFIGALSFAVLVKGMSAIVLSLLAFLYWLIVSRNRKTFSLVVSAHLIMFVVVVLFELWHREITQSSFLSSYLAFQGKATIRSYFNPWRKAYNFIWYCSRVLWFSFPWIYFLFYGGYKWLRERVGVINDKYLRFLLWGSLSVLLFFSLFDRKADRYIFPAYLLFVFAGVFVVSKTKPKIMSWIRGKEKQLPLFLGVGLVLLTFLRIFFHNRFYRFIRLWPD